MQDLIKRLADDAHNETDEAMNDAASLMDPEAWANKMYTLFAQAVARECQKLYESESARIKEIAGRDDGVFPSGPVVFGIESMRNAGDEAIRAHFGLEG